MRVCVCVCARARARMCVESRKSSFSLELRDEGQEEGRERGARGRGRKGRGGGGRKGEEGRGRSAPSLFPSLCSFPYASPSLTLYLHAHNLSLARCLLRSLSLARLRAATRALSHQDHLWPKYIYIHTQMQIHVHIMASGNGPTSGYTHIRTSTHARIATEHQMSFPACVRACVRARGTRRAWHAAVGSGALEYMRGGAQNARTRDTWARRSCSRFSSSFLSRSASACFASSSAAAASSASLGPTGVLAPHPITLAALLRKRHTSRASTPRSLALSRSIEASRWRRGAN